MAIRRHPYMKDKVIAQTWNGVEVVVDATAALLNACTQGELAAAMTTSMPLRDHATLTHYLTDARTDHPHGFDLWATRHQLTPERAITLKLEAQQRGLDLEASGQQRGHTFHPSTMGADDDEDAMTFHPSPGLRSHTVRPGETMADAPAADPLNREAYPLVDQEDNFDEDDSTYPDVNDGDVEHMRPSPSSSLRALQREGLIKRRMSPAQLSARLHLLGFPQEQRHRRLAAAQLAGFHAAASVPSSSGQRPNGDTMDERRNESPLRELTRGQKIANIQAALERVCSWRDKPTSGRVIRARAEDRC